MCVCVYIYSSVYQFIDASKFEGLSVLYGFFLAVHCYKDEDCGKCGHCVNYKCKCVGAFSGKLCDKGKSCYSKYLMFQMNTQKSFSDRS